MHIHPNQINPNMQLDSLYAAGKAAAKREVERTRKRLLECASEPAGESDSGEDCIVQIGVHEEGQQRQSQRKIPKRQPVVVNTSISDWA